jgi:hypothetical protein
VAGHLHTTSRASQREARAVELFGAVAACLIATLAIDAPRWVLLSREAKALAMVAGLGSASVPNGPALTRWSYGSLPLASVPRRRRADASGTRDRALRAQRERYALTLRRPGEERSFYVWDGLQLVPADALGAPEDEPMLDPTPTEPVPTETLPGNPFGDEPPPAEAPFDEGTLP